MSGLPLDTIARLSGPFPPLSACQRLPVFAWNAVLYAGVASSEKTIRFGESAPASPTTPRVAAPNRAAATCVGVSCGWSDSHSAATPATCGAAIEVPLIVLLAVSLLVHAEVMPQPGAKMSTQLP
jgi:hypothetical protein